MQVITSKDNEFVKHVKKLKDKKARDISGEFLVEGIKLVDEAIKENAKIKKIILCEETSTSTEMSKTLAYEIAKYDCIYVSKKVYESITDVINPQGVMAIIEKENNENLIRYDEKKYEGEFLELMRMGYEEMSQINLELSEAIDFSKGNVQYKFDDICEYEKWLCGV